MKLYRLIALCGSVLPTLLVSPLAAAEPMPASAFQSELKAWGGESAAGQPAPVQPAAPLPQLAMPAPQPVSPIQQASVLNHIAPAAAAPVPVQAAPAPMYQPAPVRSVPAPLSPPPARIAQPAPTPGVTTLDTVTVVATRNKNRTFNIPGQVSVVKKDAAENAAASDVKTLLEDVPGLEFQGSARRDGQVPVMRGFKGSSILVQFDGVRQNFESEHDGQFFVDPELLKEVEVVRGPSSTLYGSGGLGGVIAMTTVDAADLLKPGQKVGARTTAGFRSVNDEYLGSAAAYGKSAIFDVLANLSYRQSGDVELGDGSTLVADDSVVGSMFKLGIAPAAGHKFRVSYQGYNADAEEPNNPQLPLAIGSNDLVEKNNTSDTVRFAYDYAKPEDRLFKVKAQAYHVNTEVEEEVVTRTSLNNSGDVLSRAIVTDGFDLSNQTRVKLGAATENIFTYGFEYYMNDQNGTNTGSADGERGGVPDAKSQFTGGFLQSELNAKDLGGMPGEVIIIPGLRADNYTSDAATGLSQDESELSPRGGITYKPVPWLMTFGNYAHAFRAPNLTELYASGTHFSVGPYQNRFVENPTLAPEKSDTFETGMGLDFNNVASQGDNWRLKGSYYWTTAEDFIDSDITAPNLSAACFQANPPAGTVCNGGTTRFINVPEAEIEGYEIEGGYETARLLATLSYAYITGTRSDNGDYITNLIPGTLKAHLALKLPEYGVVTGWKGQLVEEHDQVNTSTAVRDAYTVHDIYARYRPAELQGLTLDAGIDNLFDENYSRIFSGAVEPGRSYLMRVSMAW